MVRGYCFFSDSVSIQANMFDEGIILNNFINDGKSRAKFQQTFHYISATQETPNKKLKK